MVLTDSNGAFSPYAYGTLTTVIFLIMIAALVTNLLVAVVIAKKSHLRSHSSHIGSNRFVLNLCITNACLVVVVFPFIIVSTIQRRWLFGDAWCQASGFFTILLSTNSLLTVMILSIDLYHCIVNPLTYHHRMTPSKTVIFIVYTWLQSLFTAILPLVGWGKYGYQEHKYSCTVVWESAVSEGYVKMYAVTSFLLPLSISCWSYYHIVKAAKRQARILPVNVPFRGSISSTTSGNFTGSKALRTTFLVLGSVTVCWGTYIITTLIESSQVHTPWGLQVSATVLICLISFIYPLIYGIRIKKTRRCIRKLVISIFNCCGHDSHVRAISSDAGFCIDTTRGFRNRSISDGSVLDFDGARELTTGWCLPAIVEETDESQLRVVTEVTDLDRGMYSIPGQIPV